MQIMIMRRIFAMLSYIYGFFSKLYIDYYAMGPCTWQTDLVPLSSTLDDSVTKGGIRILEKAVGDWLLFKRWLISMHR